MKVGRKEQPSRLVKKEQELGLKLQQQKEAGGCPAGEPEVRVTHPRVDSGSWGSKNGKNQQCESEKMRQN